MASKIFTTFLLLLFASLNFYSFDSRETWIRAGHWDSASDLPVSDIDSTLFSHLTCAFALINPSSYQVYFNTSKEQYFSTFSATVKLKNPSVISILSIRGGGKSLPVFSSMINQSSTRKSFIDSSMGKARLYGFHGIELSGVVPNNTINMSNLGTLLQEWRVAIVSESQNSGKPELLLVMAGYHLPALDLAAYPIESIARNLDWVHVIAYDYYVPTRDNLTLPHAALYGPPGMVNTDQAIKEWLSKGVPSTKLVLGLPYHGYAWSVLDSNANSTGVLASGPAITIDGSMGYKTIKSFIQNYGYGAAAVYNATYVVNFLSVGLNWINFDDIEAIKAKVAYAKEKKLRGYNVFQLSNDNNWILSRAAQGKEADDQNKKKLLVLILVIVSVVLLPLGTVIFCYFQKKGLTLKGFAGIIRIIRRSPSTQANTDVSNLRAFSFSTIKAATSDFSSENKLGEGGFGPVYKGTLPKGQEIAVKRLSKTSHQGAEEFRNEVTLTARLQHVNLARVLGFCTEREEKMLIYEYMPNKSLDYYLYDPYGRRILDWEKRVHVIEGITQGLLYLQEYSNYTIIHRDLKASNILLDEKMNPKISDFGMAKLFSKDEHEANTGRIVGTYGYVPPEYVSKGIYSMKYDVYSFGVLLLQIISGRRTNCYYGPNENLNLLEYAYDLRKEGEGMEFMDPILDDSLSPCKLLSCLQVALLCVQENPMDRPSVLEVSFMLKNESSAIGSPKRPAFSIRSKEDEECTSKDRIISVNDATISQLVAR